MIRIILLSIIVFPSSVSYAQLESLRHQIEQVISQRKATVGVSIRSLTNRDTLNVHGTGHYPMQSVFKFHVALAVLKEVDNGKYSLDMPVYIGKDDLMKNTWSPLAKQYPEGNVSIPLSEIIHNTVSLSDNSGCDILLKMLGGTQVVNDYVHSLGISDLSIQVSEREMHAEWNAQFENWSTPLAATHLLKLFYDGQLISKIGYEFLWKSMTETITGKKRLPGQLPQGTVVAHKTGTSGQSPEGITAAINDIGIITVPNGNHFAICVFVSDSREDMATNEKIIADVAKIAWDYFSK